MAAEPLKPVFLECLDSVDKLGGLEFLFENVPNLLFWVKDTEGRFVTANQNVLKMCGVRREEDIVGKTDIDFYPKHIADAFLRDDMTVIETGVKIVDRIEPLIHPDGSISWYSTNKVPLHGRNGELVGIAGTTRKLESGSVQDPLYAEFAQVIDHINREFSQPIEIQQLARIASLSLSQFERRFKQVFQETPVRFILKIRIGEACKMLIHTRRPIAWIARATGFFDQSYLSKQFSKRMGMSPRQYREKYFQGAGGAV